MQSTPRMRFAMLGLITVLGAVMACDDSGGAEGDGEGGGVAAPVAA